jgi:hypothetical protein
LEIGQNRHFGRVEISLTKVVSYPISISMLPLAAHPNNYRKPILYEAIPT